MKRIKSTRAKAAGALALAGAAALGWVFLQPEKSGAIPGWEPVNSRVMEALDAGKAGRGAPGGNAADKTVGGAPAGTVPPAPAPESARPLAEAAVGPSSTAATVSPEDAGQEAGTSANGGQPTPAQSSSGLLNLNAATAEQLDGLKGIGPSKAQAIVADRERNGPFRSVDDLLRVKGIGRKLLEGIRPYVTV